jgi:hypothetical protein
MAMGTRKQREKQEGLWIAHTELASAPGHPFYPLSGWIEQQSPVENLSVQNHRANLVRIGDVDRWVGCKNQ